MSEDIEPHILERFEIVEKLGKGNFGVVWKAIYRKYKQVVVIKKIYDAFQNTTDAKRTFREVLYHQEFSDHENIVCLLNVIKSQNGKDLYLILDYMETDLHNVIRAKILTMDHIRFIATQLFRAVRYVHSGEIIHRDIKPANILVDADCHINLIDFGLARSIAFDSNGQQPILTEYAATRWYRAPEILLGGKVYSKAVDMWALGCVLGEMLAGRPLFPGTSTLNQIERILEFTGAPSKEDIEAIESPLASDILSTLEISKARTINSYFPKVEDSELDLIKGLLEFNPKKRITVEQALRHKFLDQYPDALGDDILKKEPVLLPIDDNKKVSIKDYKETLYLEIHKRRKDIRKKIGKLIGSATSANSEQFLNSKSPSNNALQDGERTPHNKSGNSTPNNLQSKMQFSPKHFGSGSPMSKSPQHQGSNMPVIKGNFSTLATSSFGKSKQNTFVSPSAFKKKTGKQ